MNDNMQLKYAQLIAEAWMDEQLMTRLRQEPNAVLAERGIVLPNSENKRIVLVEDTPDVAHLVFPSKPEDRSKPTNDLCCMPNFCR